MDVDAVVGVETLGETLDRDLHIGAGSVAVEAHDAHASPGGVAQLGAARQLWPEAWSTLVIVTATLP
jgi:hypothetical protein